MTFRRQSGTAYVTVDGTTIPAKGSFTIPLSTKNRTDIVVGDEVVGYDEQITDETDFERICNSTAMTIRVELANGRVFTLSNAFVRGTPTVSEAGEASFDFAGKSGQWS